MMAAGRPRLCRTGFAGRGTALARPTNATRSPAHSDPSHRARLVARASPRRTGAGPGGAHRPPLRSAAGKEASDGLTDGLRPAGFREVSIVSRLAGALLIALQGERGERDDRDIGRLRVRLEPARGLPTVHPRRAEIHHDQVGTLPARERQGGPAVVRLEGLVALAGQDLDHDTAVVRVVLGNQYALCHPAALPPRGDRPETLSRVGI